jgi:hypothetical protein
VPGATILHAPQPPLIVPCVLKKDRANSRGFP